MIKEKKKKQHLMLEVNIIKQTAAFLSHFSYCVLFLNVITPHKYT